MPWERSAEGDPVRGERLVHVEHRLRTRVVATGTLACPRCDAPVSPGGRGLTPGEPLLCPFCSFDGAVRDFLSLAAPSRPAHVVIRLR